MVTHDATTPIYSPVRLGCARLRQLSSRSLWSFHQGTLISKVRPLCYRQGAEGEDVESGAGGANAGPQNRWQRIKAACWRRLGRDGRGKKKARGKASDKEGKCWPGMRCLACRRDPKVQLWPGKQARGASTVQLTASPGHEAPGKWARFKDACRWEKHFFLYI